MSILQTLMQGGIVAEDYDKIDFVKRGKTIVPSARVEALLRAAARKGYRIIADIVAVPQDDKDTTYYKENFCNDGNVYTLEDARINPDRAITAQRLIDMYFAKFICRLEVRDVKTNKRVLMTACEIPIDDLLEIANTSEQGLYKSGWEEYVNDYGYKKKRKVITDELNSPSAFWIKWTGEMVRKTVLRRALKWVKEVLPELTETIYAFEQDEYVEPIEETTPIIEIPIEVTSVDKVDLNNLTIEQMTDCQEVFELFKANPKLAEDKVKEIKQMLENGETAQEVINKEYASIFCLKKSPKKWAEIRGYFNEKG